MMDITTAEQQVFIVICSAIVALTPIVTGVIIAYLTAKKAHIEASSKPSHDEVQTLIDKKVDELQATNGNKQ